MTYSELDIRRAVGQHAFAAGQRYQAQHRVLPLAAGPDATLRARVQGSETRPYDQTIAIRRAASGHVHIAGQCSCPVGTNCKHVAAALIEGLRKGFPAEIAADSVVPLVRTGLRTAASPPAERLSPQLAGWLDDLDRAQATSTEDYPKELNQRLIYVLAPLVREPRAAQLGVNPVSARLLKDGRFSDQARSYAIDAASSGSTAKFLRPSDLRILGDLARLRRESYTATPVLFREAAVPVLADILATGRARWLDPNGPALARGEPRPGRITWRSHDGAALRPVLEAGPDLVVLNATPPLYVDVEAGLVGPVETELAPRLAATLLDAPPVPASQIAEVNAALVRRAPALAEARLPEPEVVEHVKGPAKPCLRLTTGEFPAAVAIPGGYRGYFVGQAPERVPLARLSFRYGPVVVAHGESGARLTRLQDGKLIEVRRDLDTERGQAVALRTFGLIPAQESRLGVPPAFAHDLVLAGDEMEWLDLLYHDLPGLAARGWRIDIAEDFPFRLLRSDGPIAAEVHEGSGIDWFELGLGVMIDGERIDLVEPIVALIASPGFSPASFQAAGEADEPFYLVLGDGRVLGVSTARLLPIVEAIAALAIGGQVMDGRLRLTAPDVAGLAGLEEAAAELGVTWQGGERLRAMGRRLSQASGIPPVTLPDTFRATLRPYQAEGVAWLAFLREVGFGGVLADDMGLGKTIQALALVALEKAAGRLDRPALVIAPTSLMTNWRLEAERFAPDLRVLVLQGLDRKERFGAIETSDLVLTTYPLVARDHAVLAPMTWHLLILDEAQTIKNPDAATTKLVAGFDARHRFGLTGTPLENHLGELWSLFAVVMPGFLGDRQGFTRQWRTPIEKAGDAARGKLLARRVKPFLLRRTKENVARDLPPKTEIVERIELQQGQRDIYESIRLSMHRRVRDAVADKGFARSRIVILDALLKLRQACCDPRLLKLAGKMSARAGSAKLERLMEMADELLAENRRILIFSQFTTMLDLIRPRFEDSGVSYSLLTGRTRDRAAAIERFQDGTVPVFLVSLKAGGTGLNLTAADTVILYDPWWNPAVEEQAIDRAHRIGQDKPVFVHKLVAAGTIEEKMEVMKAKKRALAESLFDHDGAPTLAMTEADLDALFAD